MEVFGLFIPNWLLVLLLLLILLYVYFTWHFGELEALGIKGPKPWPVIGNLDFMIKEGFYRMDAALTRKYGKIVSFYECRQPGIIIADPEILKHVLVKEFHNFTNRREFFMRGIFKYSVFDLEGEHWKEVRNLLTPAFSAGKLKIMSRMINNTADTLIKYLRGAAEDRSTFDAKARSDCFTLDVIAATAFGLETDAQKDPDTEVLAMGKKMTQLSPSDPLVYLSLFLPDVARLIQSVSNVNVFPAGVAEFFTKVVNKLLDDRRNHPQKHHADFLKLMSDAEKNLKEDQEIDQASVAHARKRKGLTNEEIIAQSILFFVAGYETTATTMSFLMYNLATNPECQERLIKEIDNLIQQEEPTYENTSKLEYLQMCIDETLRMYPPVARLDRRAAESITISGLHIPKGCLVYLPFHALHHDPDAWPNPEKFDPERFTPEGKASRHPYQYMPFGVGPRNCIGMRLALMEIKIAFVRILQKFKLVTCEKTQVPLRLNKKSFGPQSVDGLWLKVQSR